MIILDTNIISEMMRSSPAKAVSDWLDEQDSNEVFITTVTVAEISYGISVLPEGAKRQSLEYAFNRIQQTAFKHRILPFEHLAAHAYGKLIGHRKALGKPISIMEGQIAAITRTQEAILATRNVRDFSDCEIDLINPFSC